MAAPGLRIATINHDMNERHSTYTYGKVTVEKERWMQKWNIYKCLMVYLRRRFQFSIGSLVIAMVVGEKIPEVKFNAIVMILGFVVYDYCKKSNVVL